MQENTSMMRNLGQVLLWIGVLAGAFVAVRDPVAVSWPAYGAMAAVALVGVVLLRRTAAASRGSGEQIDHRIDVLRTALLSADEVLASLREYVSKNDDDGEPAFDVYSIHDRLDQELAEPLAEFADGRETMIPAFGMTTYSEVMTRFAAAERLVNRTWSASADGYIDEVRTCVQQASQLMGDARQTFEAAGRD